MMSKWRASRKMEPIFESEIEYKLGLLRTLLTTGLPFAVYYCIQSLIAGDKLNFAFNVLICLILLSGMVAAFRTATPEKRVRQIILYSFAYLIILAMLHLSFIFSRRLDQYAWFVLFPLLALISLGFKYGTIAVAIYFAAIVATISLVDTVGEVQFSTRSFIIQTLLSTAAAAIISFIFELNRRRVHERLYLEKEKLLSSEKQMEQLNKNLEMQVGQRTDKLIQINKTLIEEIKIRKESESALQESEQKFRDLFENVSDFLFTHDMDGRLLESNIAVKKIWATTSGTMADMNFRDILFKKNLPLFDAYLQRIVTNDYDEGYFRFPDKEGRTHYAEYKNQLVRDAQGRPRFVRGSARDVTERLRAEKENKRLQERLQQAQKFEAIATLSGGIAHDFNNLMMGIQGRASMIKMESADSDPHMEHIRAIEGYILSAKSLTRQILGFARGGKYEVTPIDIDELVDSTAAMFGRTHKEIVIHHHPIQTRVVVSVDKLQIEQVLLNLIINAWQAMPKGGDLYLETSRIQLDDATAQTLQINAGGYAKISVTDTGVGIEPAVLGRIFDPFFTTKEKDRGTGLGLASAYGIIKNHAGALTVYSEVGRGTTFNIYLPVTDQSIRRETTGEDELKRGSETILIVDDEQIIVEVTTGMLQMLGYCVSSAKNGSDALEIVRGRKNEIDLVILDMIMPGMEGGDVFDQLRAIRADLPVLLSSGYSMNGKAGAIMDRGCNGFVQKPFNVLELSRKIREILDPLLMTPPADRP